LEEINFDSIKEQLKSKNPEARRVCVEKIAEHPSQESLSLLFETIGDENWRVRKTAAESLAHLHNFEGFYKQIFSALDSEENAGKRNTAVEIIIRIGEDAVTHVTDFLPYAGFDVKKLLIDALGDIENVLSADTIKEFLNDNDENVRAAAAEALGKIKNKSSVKHLVNVLEKDDMQLQFSALEALESIGEPIDISYITPLFDKKILRKAAIEVLGKSRDKNAVKYLIGALNDSSKASREAAIKAIINVYNAMSDEEDKDEVIKSIRKISSEELIAKLAGSLCSPNPNIQKSVITLFGFLKAVSMIPKILNVKRDEELRDCKFNAIVLMGKESYDIIKEEFITRNESDRYVLAQIMGVLKDDRYEKILTDSLKDSFGHLRSAAALSLARLGKVESIAHIFPHLNDPYKDVQAAVLEALTTLGRLYPEEIRTEIESNLRDNDDKFKISIISLIGRIGIKKDIKYLDMALRYGNPDIRTAAVYAIGAVNVLEDSKHLILTLTDESENVRIATAKTLGLLYSKESCDALLRALEDNNIWVQINAMRSLAKLNATNSIKQIQKFLRHENPLLIINAMESLKELNAPKLKEYFLELLHHKDMEIIKTAITVLKESFLDEKTLNEILDLLNSDVPEVRILVYKSLENIKDEKIVQKVKPFIEKEKDEIIKRIAKKMLGV
jgi:HEAT repeat protein